MSLKLDLGFMTQDLREIPAYARRAEELGVGALWSAETKHDPFLPLAVAAANTTRAQLGTAIAVAFPRSPMIMAHTAWDLQKVSCGRFGLGLGTQVKAHNERRFSLKWEPPGPRLREVIEALRAIWDSWQNGTPLNFRGKSYRFDLMTPFFDPGPIEHPHIPVYIAAVNPWMARMAGEICDGLHVHSFHTPKYLREAIHPAVEEGLRISGRTRKRFVFRASTMVVLGDTPEELARNRQAVKQQIAFYASTRTYQAVLAVHGLDHLVPQLHAKSLAGDWKGMADLITDETLDHVAVTASWETVGAKLRQRSAALSAPTHPSPPFPPSPPHPPLQALLKEMNA